MIDWIGADIELIRQEGDVRIKSESSLHYMVKLWLQNQSIDVVKKCPSKDGHLTDAPYYIRRRDWNGCWIDPDYMLRDPAKSYNHGGRIILRWNDLGGRS